MLVESNQSVRIRRATRAAANRKQLVSRPDHNIVHEKEKGFTHMRLTTRVDHLLERSNGVFRARTLSRRTQPSPRASTASSLASIFLEVMASADADEREIRDSLAGAVLRSGRRHVQTLGRVHHSALWEPDELEMFEEMTGEAW